MSLLESTQGKEAEEQRARERGLHTNNTIGNSMRDRVVQSNGEGERERKRGVFLMCKDEADISFRIVKQLTFYDSVSYCFCDW